MPWQWRSLERPCCFLSGDQSFKRQTDTRWVLIIRSADNIPLYQPGDTVFNTITAHTYPHVLEFLEAYSIDENEYLKVIDM